MKPLTTTEILESTPEPVSVPVSTPAPPPDTAVGPVLEPEPTPVFAGTYFTGFPPGTRFPAGMNTSRRVVSVADSDRHSR